MSDDKTDVLEVPAADAREHPASERLRPGASSKLRDRRNLEGKCGACGDREICGGSRARSFAMTGEMFRPRTLMCLRAEATGGHTRQA
jgi:MoaA/NifB/PqqE/SkfB family radical SAM enzyme